MLSFIFLSEFLSQKSAAHLRGQFTHKAIDLTQFLFFFFIFKPAQAPKQINRDGVIYMGLIRTSQWMHK